MKNLFPFLCVLCLVLAACQTLVTKQAHVIPIIDNKVILSAEPKFFGGKSGNIDDTNSASMPAAWAYERCPDGSIKITWTIAEGATEELVLTDAGLFPMAVPQRAIHTINKKGMKLPISRPTEIIVKDVNSAFIWENLKLKPYKRK